MADDSEQLGQDDIEALLNAAQNAKADDTAEPAAPSDAESSSAPTGDTPATEQPGDEIPENLGQDGIEALLNAGAPPAATPPAAAPVEESTGLDQSEIEALLGGGPSAPKPKPVKQTASNSPNVSGESFTDVDLLLNHAEQTLASIDNFEESLPPGMKPFKFEDFSGSPPSTEAATLDLVRDVELDLKIELGRTHMHLEEVLKLHKGSVVPLDKLAGDPVDIYVNGRLIARGEVLVLNDNFCVRVAELIEGDQVEVA